MSDPYQTQTDLLRRLVDLEDHESWTEFYTLYQPLLLRYVRSCDLSEADANDVVQDIVVTKLRKALPTFSLDRSRGRFRTWLWQVTMNAIRDWSRRLDARQRLSQRMADALEGHAESVSNELHAQWERAHHHQVLRFAMEKVKASSDPKTWACFAMRALEDKPASDIARALGVTPSAVYTNTHRTLVRVRELCWQYDEEIDDESPDSPTAAHDSRLPAGG